MIVSFFFFFIKYFYIFVAVVVGWFGFLETEFWIFRISFSISMQSVVGLLRSDLDRMLEVASLDTKAKKLSKQKYLEKGEKKEMYRRKHKHKSFK